MPLPVTVTVTVGLGGGLVVVTLSWKIVLRLALPSLTVTVMLAVPLWPAAGVRVTERLLPEPPKMIPNDEINVGFDEPEERVRLEAAVSTSLIVKGIAAVGVSCRVV